MKQCILLMLLMMLLTGCTDAKTELTRAMFAWNGVSEKDLPVLEKYNINTLYIDTHYFSKVQGYKCYLLVGDPSWDLEDMKEAVKNAKEKDADGIIFDIEGDYEKLSKNLEKLDSSIPVAVCYPYWLDEPLIERIVKASDESVVMNYYVGKEKKHLEEEILIIKKYGKKLTTAYELHPVTEDIPEVITYQGDMDAVLNNYKQFIDVGIAIHWLKYAK